jgi:NAD(P)-dependent dehydrogenase (short-subunit alcohol dehydrogenase family)
MRDKTALVTGSTAGIGKETARGLARLGARVILVGRDPERADRAAKELQCDTGNDRVSALTADVTRLGDLARLAAQVSGSCASLHVLINNAGAYPTGRQLTPDGVEATFAAHVLAPFTLARLLLPLLRRGAPARVINITGGIPGGRIDPGNLQAERRYLGWTFSQYNHTKTMLMAVSRRLARDLEGTGVTVNVTYPGHGHTPMNQAMTMRAFPLAYRPLVPLIRVVAPRFSTNLARAATSSIYLASAGGVEGVSGAYFDRHCRRRPLPASVLDDRNCHTIWAQCEQLAAATLQAAGRSGQ